MHQILKHIYFPRQNDNRPFKAICRLVMPEGTMATEKQVTKSAKMFWGSAVDVSQEEVT